MVNNYKQDEEKTKFSWRNFARIGEFIKPYKKQLIGSFLIGVIANVLLLFIPKIMVYAIDVSFVNKDFLEVIKLTVLMLVIVLGAVKLIQYKRDKIIVVLDKVAYDIKLAIFQKLQVLPNNYFDTRSHGKIFTRATSYPDDAAIIVCYVLLDVILDIISLFFVVFFMLSTNVKLSLISIVLSLILVVLFVVLAPVKRRLKHVVNDKVSNVNAYLSESINGIKITQSFNREIKNESILKKLEKERIEAFKRTCYINHLNWSLTGLLNYISMALLFYIGLRFMYPAVSIGVLLAIDSYASKFWGPIEYLTSSYSDLMDASTYLERIFELLDEPLIIEDKKNAQSLDIKGNIEFRDVVFGYNEEKLVLDKFNLKIKAGEKVGLVGETGCGKSTVLALLSRFYDVNAGEILIDGVNIKDIKLTSLRGAVNMMLQDNFLFARSVYDNLVLDKDISKEEVIKICKMLDVHDIIMKLDKGYETILFNNGSGLSSGERQLLCMARIMVQNQRILILDEATSNIDIKTERKLQKAIEMITRDRTTIMVAHRISTIKNCDKIVLVKNKQNFEEGTHLSLLKKKGDYAKLYNSQAGKKK